MTNIALDRPPAVITYMSKLFTVGFMIIGLFLSITMLKWAINNKIPTADITPSAITAKVRERQLACLATNIYHEAGSESFEGMVGVAQVVMNRTTSGKFPDDVCKVVYQKDDHIGLCQFSWYCMPNVIIKPKNREVFARSEEVAKKVLLEGFRLPSLENALYFHGDYINPNWSRVKVAHIGRHIFYK